MRPAVVELPGSVGGGRRGRRPLTRTPGASFERGLKRPGEPHSDARRRLFRIPTKVVPSQANGSSRPSTSTHQLAPDADSTSLVS